MAISRATLRTEAELHQYLLGITDAQTRALTAAWVDVFEHTKADLELALNQLAAARQAGDVVSYTIINRDQQARAALARLQEALDYVAQQTGTVIAADVRAVLEHAAGAEYDMIASQLEGPRRAALQASLVRADPRQIGEMVLRSTQQITALSWPLSAATYEVIRQELLRGMALGTNPRQAARRMVANIGDRVDLGLSRALNIARTEMLDAARAAALEVDKANSRVLAGWVWTAHLDAATCRSCVAMHGSLHPVEEPGPYDHQSGRCARVPKTKTWEELGFTGITDPPDSLADADAWFSQLRPEEQRRMLGRDGYAAWQAGDYPRSQWSTRRTTDGWRPSHVPSRPPQALAHR